MDGVETLPAPFLSAQVAAFSLAGLCFHFGGYLVWLTRPPREALK